MRWKWPLFGEKPYCVRRPGGLIAPGVVSCHSAGRARSAWPAFDSRGAQVPAHSELRQGCGKVRQGAVRSLCLLVGPADQLGRQILDTGARPRSPRVPRAQVSRPRSTRARTGLAPWGGRGAERVGGTGIFWALGAGPSLLGLRAGSLAYSAGRNSAGHRSSSALQRGAAQQVQRLLGGILTEPAGLGRLV